MTDNLSRILAALAFAGVVLLGGIMYFSTPHGSFGAVSGMLAESYIPYISINGGYNSAKPINTSALLSTTGTFSIGASGTAFQQLQGSTCSLIASSFTVAASTTVSMDCAVTGVVSGDKVIADFASSTTPGNGWAIDGSSASTTAAFITLRVTNWTGASNVIPASLASSTDYLVFR